MNVAKPTGWTSHDVVARVRRLTGQRRAGHAGTLDPAATGVLPVALGRATRLIEYLADATKEYRAEIRLGTTTTTLDAEGEIVETRPFAHITHDQIVAALDRFRGKIEQVPPMYSALRVGGRRLYDLARRGETVERAPRTVEISRLDLIDYRAPDLTLAVECSKGTYIRTLADDLGRAIGCGAHLARLSRTRVGPFGLAEAADLDRLAAIGDRGAWDEVIWAPDAIVIDWPAIVIDPADVRAVAQGRPIPADPPPGAALRARVYSAAGDFLAIAEWRSGARAWHPVKVLAEAAADRPRE